MNTYEVELRRTSFITVWVEAETEEEAEALAWSEAQARHDSNDASWDIESIEETGEPPEPEFPEPTGKLLRDCTTDDFNPKMNHWSDK